MCLFVSHEHTASMHACTHEGWHMTVMLCAYVCIHLYVCLYVFALRMRSREPSRQCAQATTQCLRNSTPLSSVGTRPRPLCCSNRQSQPHPHPQLTPHTLPSQLVHREADWRMKHLVSVFVFVSFGFSCFRRSTTLRAAVSASPAWCSWTPRSAARRLWTWSWRRP